MIKYLHGVHETIIRKPAYGNSHNVFLTGSLTTNYIKEKIFIWLILSAALVQAQRPSDYDQLKAAYPDYPGIIEKKSIKIDLFFNDQDSLNARITRSQRTVLLKNLPGKYSSESIQYSSWEQTLENIAVACYIPMDKKYKKTVIDEFLNKDELSNSVFYQDVSSKNFNYPSTQEGTIYDLEYTLLLKNPRFLPVIYASENMPILDFTLEVSYPETVAFNIDFFNLDKDNYVTSTDRKGKVIKQVIQRKNIPELEYIPFAPSLTYYCPQIFLRVLSYEKDGKEVPYLRDVKDLHNYYKYWVEDIDNGHDSTLVTLVDSLVNDQMTTFEKVKRIYYWVQDNIKYIAFEDGVAGFVPAKPTVVCKSRYGDCKGMAGLTYQMLKEAGIPSHLTWIGSRDRPYKYSELPTPSVDNHMITTYIDDDGEHYFLDATGGNVPIDQTTSFIQGKEALIHQDSTFVIKQVPVQSASRNQIIDSVTVTIDGADLKGEGEVSFGGLYRNRFRSKVLAYSDKENREFFESVLEKGSNKFKLDDYTILNADHKDEPVRVEYTFTIPDYVKSYGEEVFLNINLTKVNFGDFIEEDRVVPYELDIAGSYKYTVELKYDPAELEITFVPENSSYTHELFGFENSYMQASGSLKNTFASYEDFLLLDKEHFESRNAMIKNAKRSYNESVSLKKK